MTMQLEYDPENLIAEVKKRPGIWNFEHPDYRDKHLRHELWLEIVRELMDPDMKVSKSETRELELQIQKKWKSIRDCFQKYISNPGRTRRPYIYNKQLQFLLKSEDSQDRDFDLGSEDSNSRPQKKVWRTKKRLKLMNPEHQSSEDDNDNEESQEVYVEYSNDADNVEVPAKIPRTSNTHSDFAFANVEVNKNDDDPDKLFLLSLLPHMKSIPEEFRLNVKMDLMQVLRNANYMSTREHKLL
ncbi:uncharacterized protein LOC128678787 [Plodia interpunctella]|uniref:uncharacterized protein LOC128678787 n=1 Tax=Plodia interpunctella TaxID=58824 RepID=UPI0023678D20|nr:uncharacterized protein LOC128678787 [Plodia interpunctella]